MKALLLIDLQNDFCKGGALEVKDGEKVIPIANLLIEKFKKSGNLVIATKDWHPISHKSFAQNSNGRIGETGTLNGLSQIWWPVHCVENTSGSEFHPNLDKNIDNIIYKGNNKEIDSYSGFFDNGKLTKTNLDNILKKNNIKTIYIMGLATDFCVKFTVLDGLELGYEIFLIEDGCRGVNLQKNSSENAIKEMKNKGAIIIKSSDIL